MSMSHDSQIVSQFVELRRAARRRLLQMHYEAKVGHIGGNLSCLDAILFLHHFVMGEHDQFVLAKGHSVGALYIALWSRSYLTDADLQTFHKDHTHLAGHPVSGWSPHVSVATGSLGHGFPVATGMAMAKQLQGQDGRVYCLMSDGEWQEGSNWEALIFAAHRQLDKLTVLVDVNGLQGFGSTTEIASMGELAQRITAFGATVREIDGHDPQSLCSLLLAPQQGFQVILLKTIKGKGVPFMEGKMEWHYLPLNADQYAVACQEIEEGTSS